MEVWVVNFEVEEIIFDDSFTSCLTAGLFSSEKKAEEFAEKYRKKWKEEHKGQIGWGYPDCNVCGPFEIDKEET